MFTILIALFGKGRINPRVRYALLSISLTIFVIRLFKVKKKFDQMKQTEMENAALAMTIVKRQAEIPAAVSAEVAAKIEANYLPPKIEAIEAYAESGVERVLFSLPPAPAEEILPKLEKYAGVAANFA